MSIWHDELDMILVALEDCPIHCVEMTYSISHLLKQAGIDHLCMSGAVTDDVTSDSVVPHCWVELEDDWVIDYRLRMWLGDEDRIPHGVFRKATYPGLSYYGQVCQVRAPNRDLILMFTGGLIDKLVLPNASQRAEIESGDHGPRGKRKCSKMLIH